MIDICRLCLLKISSCDITIYKDDVPNESKIKGIIPEIDLQMTSSLTLCNLCSRLLNVAYEFKRGCLKTEENLRQFLKEYDLTVPIDLTTYVNLKGIKNEINEENENSIEIDSLDNTDQQFDVDTASDNDGCSDHKEECNLHKCNKCAKEFQSNKELQTHFAEHTSANKSVPTTSKLKITSTKSKSSYSSFICDICRRSFKRKGCLQSHMRIHSCQESHSCPICNRKVLRRSHLQRHIRSHSNKTPVCDLCGESFTERLALGKHMKIKHNKPNICETCGMICCSNGAFILHMRTHTGERPFHCEICGKQFAQKCTLTTHVRSMHETKTPYVCDKCGKAFRVKSNLTKHLIEHQYDNAEKTVPCKFENCDKRFYTTRKRDKHMVWHGERNVLCNLCAKAFVDNSSLKKHMRIHKGESQQISH